ncbi:MAG: hypothetical protein LV481_03330 [Methylacidiphilales bacterium]|nr:hypothetical protein [Candidatus Methylacidiphilales bacterium]
MRMGLVVAVWLGVAMLSVSSLRADPITNQTLSNLNDQVSDAQKQVDKARDKFDSAADDAASGMASSDRSDWRHSVSGIDNLVDQAGRDKKSSSYYTQVQKNISAQSAALKQQVKPGDSSGVSSALADLVQACANLTHTQSKLALARQQLDTEEDASNQNGTRTVVNPGFSIRTQRDSNNNSPTLPQQ